MDYDLVARQPYAFGIKEAFEIAKREGVKKIALIEFGVAAGAGFFNMNYIARKLSKFYGIDYEVIGFDTGKGMPKPIDYRDHPEKYREGDFPPVNIKSSSLPEKSCIYYGDIGDELSKFAKDIEKTPTTIGFISIDVDYFSSTLKCFELFDLPAKYFLSRCPVYLDDVNNIDHNEFCGELLAVKEFNQRKDFPRKICPMNQLRNWRVFKNALFLDQMYFLHVFDHDLRKVESWENEEKQVLSNPYL